MKFILLMSILTALFSCSQDSGSSQPAASQPDVGSKSVMDSSFEKMSETDMKSEIDLFSEQDQVTLLVTRNIRLKAYAADHTNLFRHLRNKYNDYTNCGANFFIDDEVILQKGDRFVFRSAIINPNDKSTSVKTLYFGVNIQTPADVEINCHALIRQSDSNLNYVTFQELLDGTRDFIEIYKRK